MTAFYFAGRYVRREELAEYARQAEDAGHKVTSQWLAGPKQIIAGLPLGHAGEELAERGVGPQADRLRGLCAEVDIHDIRLAEALVSFSGGGGRGGRHVEFGIALAARRDLYIIGERESFFHYLVPDQNVYPDWPAFLADLGGLEDPSDDRGSDGPYSHEADGYMRRA